MKNNIFNDHSKKIKEILSQLTLEEKASLLVGASKMGTAEIEKVGIKPVNLCDGPHGVRVNYDHIGAVSFPSLSTLGATWNEEMAYKMGMALANECIRFGKDMLLGPGLNMKRNDLCGRNFEYFSEDPIHTGVLGAAYINGLQDHGIGACAKHYAVNNQETDRLHISSEIDERTMREIYLKAFQYVVKHSNPASIMCAVNKVNSVLCSENKKLYDILKKEWGYEGFVMSDWGCCKDSVKSVKAGLDLAMPENPDFVPRLLEGVQNGEITEAEIDEAAERFLSFALNVQKPKSTLAKEDCHNICREIEEEAIVLLKNNDNLLPITKEKYKRIAVVGEFAEKPVISGFGSSTVFPNEEQIESPLKYIKDYCGNDIEVVYIPAYPTNEYLKEPQFNALSYMKTFEDVDLVLMFVGREVSIETEGSDRVTSHLNPLFEFIIKRIYPRNQNIVLVAQTGGAFMHLSWEHKIKSIVQMWLGGEAAGSAIANVLFGKVNPSGKLSESFPIKTRTDIDYPGDGYKVCYDEKWRIGYRYYDLHTDELWFPFGHGLSYTKFDFSNLSITKTENGFSVECKVKNIGDTAGKEVVQVYFSDRISTFSRPKKELVAFKKTKFLEPQEEITVKFDIANEDLAYYNTTIEKWTTEPGTYDILVGASSQDIRLNGEYLYNSKCEYTLSYNAEQMMG